MDERQQEQETAEQDAAGVVAEPQQGADETTGEAYSDADRRNESDPAPEPEAEVQAQPEAAEAFIQPEIEGQDSLTAEQLLMDTEQPAQFGDSNEAELLAVLEAIVYITDEPLSAKQIADALQKPLDYVKTLLDKLVEEFNKPQHGLTVKEVAGGYKITTKPEHHEAVRAFVKNLNPPLKLSLAALETLAVIAYKQPITAPEIMEIRGVQGAGVLKTLLDRKLITSAGRKNVVGKPILYKTTKEFLVQFGLRDLNELPSLKEFEDLRRFAFSDADEAPLQAAAEAPKPAEPAPEPDPEPELQEAETTHE
ncbi:MAG TPA: SMC-Scp complex subunit ScpB [Bryobacteraceae bacterium]|nr:SMC-Scp complex subunit ScpB [Bryobacteraceae bacterium]